MVSLRSGPVEIMSIGAPISSSTLDVSAGVGWQFFQGLGAHGRFGPTWHFFVHRLQAHVAVSVGRGNVVALCVFVADADVDGFQAVEYVQLGQANARNAVHIDSATQDNGVEPTATTSTASGGAEFVTLLGQVRANVVEQFSRERTRAYTGGVSLGDAQDVVQNIGPTPEPVATPPAVVLELVTYG